VLLGFIFLSECETLNFVDVGMRRRTVRTTPYSPGVADICNSDGNICATIFIGLIQDGFQEYRDLSEVNDSIKLEFVGKPLLFCHDDDLRTFYPLEDEIISIKVCRRRSFRIVKRSSAIARITDCTDWQHAFLEVVSDSYFIRTGVRKGVSNGTVGYGTDKFL